MIPTDSITRTCAAALALFLAGCAEVPSLATYSPTVDPARTNMTRFSGDLEECREIASNLQAEYQKRQEQDLAINIMAGLVSGAIIGGSYGGSSQDRVTGAAIGGLAGAAHSEYSGDLIQYGPQRVVDRCMAARGYVILNDLGRG